MKILAASHGAFASGIKSSLDVLLGKSDMLTVIDGYLDQDSLDVKLDKFFESVPETEQVVMLSDLYGGSVNQKMYLRLTRPNTFLITGMNLALVLALVMNAKPVNQDMLQAIVKDSQEAIKLVEIESTGTDEQDFFGGS